MTALWASNTVRNGSENPIFVNEYLKMAGNGIYWFTRRMSANKRKYGFEEIFDKHLLCIFI